ncbi:MAG: CCA tRNA nucleotidyltransferase [Candidatus Moranbacteria bacterium]|nr:CCA tRNA nucleotidyltransferase [Candidatus Moranbacteria bacterium]
MIQKIPQPVIDVLKALREASFEAFVVGGCVRDLLLECEPKDWDITTNAKPEEVQTLFPDSFYENEFGTVGVKVVPFLKDGKADREHDIVEVTTYRVESDYADKRRPNNVAFTHSLEEDLARRDFTINAIALSMDENDAPIIIDPFGGQEDLKKRIIRTVGVPDDRFNEDALRMMRAVRFYAKLRTTSKQAHLPGDPKYLGIYEPELDNWIIEQSTFKAIQKNAIHLTQVSFERIQAELSKIILSDSPAEGIDMLQKVKLLKYILPELEEGLGIGQNLHHIYQVYQHNILALKYCPSKKLDTRLAALLHDVGKPRTKRGDGYRSTFYNHDHVGARMSDIMLKRLRYPKAIVDKVALLVDNHLFYYNVDEVTEASVRRLVRRVGLENMPDLMDIRIADRLGSGTPKAKPYKLRHLEYMIDKVSKDAVSVKMLKINGKDLMSDLKLAPGPKIGAILDVLLSEVIEDAALNTREHLMNRAAQLDKEHLESLRSMAKEKIEEKRESDNQAIKKKYWVQ